MPFGSLMGYVNSVHTNMTSQSHMGMGGIKKPTPYPKAENWLPSKKTFDSFPPLRQKFRHF